MIKPRVVRSTPLSPYRPRIRRAAGVLFALGLTALAAALLGSS
ncbi:MULTISPECIES: hypothetical protein [unclassified Caulobacter]|nr:MULTISPECIES: hypothetical protein [unclassified Caulobacter]